MDKSKRKFRKSIRGYNKKDVNRYISEINSELVSSSEEYKIEIDGREQTIAILRGELDDQRRACDALSEEVDALNKLIEEYKADKESMQDKIRELEDKIASLESCGVSNDDTREKIVIDEDLLDKARSYDAIRAKIDEILSYARSEAEQIIRNAEKTVSSFENDKSANVQKVKKEISEKSNSIIEDLKSLFRRYTK